MPTQQDLRDGAADGTRERRRPRDQQRVFGAFRAAVVLLASVEVGLNVDRIVRVTGVKRSFVAQCARRLVDNGVWANGTVRRTWTTEHAPADPAFWNDVAVAEGQLYRRCVRDEIEWAAPGEWFKDYTLAPREPAGPQVSYRARVPPERPRRAGRHAPPDAPDHPGSGETVRPTGPEAEQPATEETVLPPDSGPTLFPDARWLR